MTRNALAFLEAMLVPSALEALTRHTDVCLEAMFVTLPRALGDARPRKAGPRKAMALFLIHLYVNWIRIIAQATKSPNACSRRRRENNALTRLWRGINATKSA